MCSRRTYKKQVLAHNCLSLLLFFPFLKVNQRHTSTGLPNHYKFPNTLMRLRQLIQDLPQSLLLISLAITCAAVPVKSTLPPPLTPENFKSTISHGWWYVEHFSPHCWHCREFMPTWEELVKRTDQGEFPGLHTAQVDCAIHGGASMTAGYKALLTASQTYATRTA